MILHTGLLVLLKVIGVDPVVRRETLLLQVNEKLEPAQVGEGDTLVVEKVEKLGLGVVERLPPLDGDVGPLSLVRGVTDDLDSPEDVVVGHDCADGASLAVDGEAGGAGLAAGANEVLLGVVVAGVDELDWVEIVL